MLSEGSDGALRVRLQRGFEHDQPSRPEDCFEMAEKARP